MSEVFRDADLSDNGKIQCKQFASKGDDILPDLIVISPMNRTLQTATFCFPSLVHTIPWVAIEAIREISTPHPYNQRSSLADLRIMYPHVDFSHVLHEFDPLPNDRKETADEVAARGEEFLEWLSKRKEQNIVVVTHAVFLMKLFEKVLQSDDSLDASKYDNCELRSYELVIPENRVERISILENE